MQIDVEHTAVGREREIDRKCCLEDAGVVHEDVEGADVGLCRADEILERLRAGEIPLDPVNRVPEVGDLLDVHRRDDPLPRRRAVRRSRGRCRWRRP